MPYMLFYDTETTGLPLDRVPMDDARQPHIVQLAALMVDESSGDTAASINLTNFPDGWVIPADVAKIHGISTDRALATGVSERMAVRLFYEMWMRCEARCAHNEKFDASILKIALLRFGFGAERVEAWDAGTANCTATMAAPIMNLPPTERMVASGRLGPKTPNLGEAHRHFLGAALEGAHDAMVDVVACMRIYAAMRVMEAA